MNEYSLSLAVRDASRVFWAVSGIFIAAAIGLVPVIIVPARADEIVKVVRIESDDGIISGGDDFFDLVDGYGADVWPAVKKFYSKSRENRRFRKKIERFVRAQSPDQIAETLITSVDGAIVAMSTSASFMQLGIPLDEGYFEPNSTRVLPSGETILTSQASSVFLNSLLVRLSLEELSPHVPDADGEYIGSLAADGDCAFETGPIEIEFRGPLFEVKRERALMLGGARGDANVYAIANEPIRSTITEYASGRLKLDIPERPIELYVGKLSDSKAVLRGRNYEECTYEISWQ